MKSYGNILAERRFLAKNWSEVLQTNEFWEGFHLFINNLVKLKIFSFKLMVCCSQSCGTHPANFGVVLSCCNFASAFRRSNHNGYAFTSYAFFNLRTIYTIHSTLLFSPRFEANRIAFETEMLKSVYYFFQCRINYHKTCDNLCVRRTFCQYAGIANL